MDTDIVFTLPHDIIINILSRLPIKALCKLMCVSKQFFNLISNPSFINAHHDRSKNTPDLLLARQNNTTLQLFIRDRDGNAHHDFTISVIEPIQMMPSRWDIVCFSSQKRFYACNPSTQEFVTLPRQTPCAMASVTGDLGYLSASNEYVLIHLFHRSLMSYPDHDHDLRCEILRFSDGQVGSSSWKAVEGKCPYLIRGHGVFIDKLFYWNLWQKFLMSFDLEKEEFNKVSLPTSENLDPNGWLGELRGFLCFIDNNVTRPLVIDIWMMKDCQNRNWVKEYVIDYTLYNLELQMPDYIIPLDDRNGEILMVTDSFECYNIENKSFRRIGYKFGEEWMWLGLSTDSFFSLGACGRSCIEFKLSN